MYECDHGSVPRGDSPLVRSELSVNENGHGHRCIWFRKGQLVLLFLGCSFFINACANDAADDTPREHKHRHRHGDQGETVDRSNSSSPTPTPAAGW